MFKLFVATIEKVLFNEEVISVSVPGTVGYFQVLQNHAAIISSLTSGKLVVTLKNNTSSIWAISGGMFEFSENKASLLADAAELNTEIDVKRAEIARKKALKRIEMHESAVDLLRSKKALMRAKNRIKIGRA